MNNCLCAFLEYLGGWREGKKKILEQIKDRRTETEMLDTRKGFTTSETETVKVKTSS